MLGRFQRCHTPHIFSKTLNKETDVIRFEEYWEMIFLISSIGMSLIMMKIRFNPGHCREQEINKLIILGIS